MAIDHDYCSASDPSALGQNEDLREEMQRSRTQVEELSVRKHFCLERFAATADDILFYTRFNINQSTVSRIIITWANFLYALLGVKCLWMSEEEVKAHLPVPCKDPDASLRCASDPVNHPIESSYGEMYQEGEGEELFDTVIPLSITGSINQLYSVACFLVDYQNGPLVKAWAKEK
ncbi:unnamed protein product [Coregonus sp. 'balchen']|nr:unnamed protein product [Coregonus sp. 'balchen']